MIWNGLSSLSTGPGQMLGVFLGGEETSTTVDQTDIRGLVTALHFLRPGLPLSKIVD